MPKYKTQTNDLTEVIESGDVSGKLYMHILKFGQADGTDIINEYGAQIRNVYIYIVCNSPTVLSSSSDYAKLLINNQENYKFIYTQCSYDSSFGSEQKSIINSFLIYTYNKPNLDKANFNYSLKYYKTDSLASGITSIAGELSSLYFQKNETIVIPLG